MGVTIESAPTTKSSDFDPIVLDPSDFLGEQSFLQSITEILLTYISRPSVVKYGILSNNRCSKLHAVLDCLFLTM